LLIIISQNVVDYINKDDNISPIPENTSRSVKKKQENVKNFLLNFSGTIQLRCNWGVGYIIFTAFFLPYSCEIRDG
jgi:hypothetical protein